MTNDREYLDLLSRSESGVVSNDDFVLIGDSSLQTAMKVKVGTLLEAVVKDFYAQDADPGAVGAGSVWKDTGTLVGGYYAWYERNAANDGWDAYAVIAAEAAGAAYADVSRSAVAVDGDADASGRATATGTGGAIAQMAADSSVGSGNASSQISAASGSGVAATGVRAVTDTGSATTAALAVRGGVTAAGLYPEVSGADVALLGFNAVALTGGIAIPQLPATPTEQDIADVLVALGLVTQAAP